MKEIWKNIKGYENLYQVSNLGNVRSLTHIVRQYNGTKYIYRKYIGKILKFSISKKGYAKVILRNREKSKTYLVHRLVAEHFISNSNNLSQINHKDENKLNNCINNLEWCSSGYNINYGKRNKKVSKSLKNKPKTKEHINKLKEKAKKRTLIRNKKGQIIDIKKG